MNNQVVYDIWLGKYTYSEVKEREINLGLDLKGGMNVILEVSVKNILKELANNPAHPILNKSLELADQMDLENQNDYLVNFFLKAFEEIKKQDNVSINLSDPKLFGTKELNDKLGFKRYR